MTKLKKILKYISLYLALMCLLIGIRLAGYIIAHGYTPPPHELFALACLIILVMGVMLLLAGLLTEKEDGKAKLRHAMIWLGLILAAGSAVGLFIVFPTLPA